LKEVEEEFRIVVINVLGFPIFFIKQLLNLPQS